MQKICSTCKLEKPVELFNKDKYKPDGLTSSCKSCISNRWRFVCSCGRTTHPFMWAQTTRGRSRFQSRTRMWSRFTFLRFLCLVLDCISHYTNLSFYDILIILNTVYHIYVRYIGTVDCRWSIFVSWSWFLQQPHNQRKTEINRQN